MKKKVFLWAISLMFLTNIFAQDWSSSIYNVGKLYPGYIIKNDGTKIEGYIEAQYRASNGPIGSSNQDKVIFFTDPKNKKTKIAYKPEDLKGYKIADKVYKTMNYSGGLLAKPLRFLLLVNDGHIARYAWYDQNGYEGINIPKFDEKLILQKGDEKPVELSSFTLGFAKKMSEFVSDYKEQADKITNKDKGYGLLKIYDIIDEYNAWYLKHSTKN